MSIRLPEEFRAPREDEISNPADLNGFPAEVAGPSHHDRPPDPAGGGAQRTDEVTFPVFASDEALTEEEYFPPPEDAAAQRSSSHSRFRIGLFSGFLLLVVVLQAVPSFLWLRQRFATSIATDAPLSNTAAPRAAPSAATVATSGESAPDKTTTHSPTVVAPPTTVAAASERGVRRPAKGTSVSTAIPATPSVARLTVTAPMPMQIYFKGKPVGITDAEATLLPAGNHDLEFVNDAVGYRTTQRVNLRAGQTTRVRLTHPTGLLSLNAIPWAEVWIDDKRIGETPLGNVPVPIGSREVLFRHPQLGERRATVLITLKAPARLSVDLRQK